MEAGRGIVSIIALLLAVGMMAGQEPVRSLTVPQTVPREPDTARPSPNAPRTSFQRPSTIPPGTMMPESPVIPPPSPLPEGRELYLPDGSRVPLPGSGRQLIRFAPRYDKINAQLKLLPDDVTQLTFVGGLIVNVTYEKPPETPGGPPGVEELEFAADSGVVWVRGAGGANVLGGITTETNPSDGSRRVDAEVFLNGNVIIRTKTESRTGQPITRSLNNTLRADQIYYDVRNNRCIALDADLEIGFERQTDTVHLRGGEIWRLGDNEWQAKDAAAFSSKLPSDPVLTLSAQDMTYTRRRVPRRNLFGIPYRNLGGGEVAPEYEQEITARNVLGEYSGIPFFYLPYLRTDASDPLGPLAGIGFGNDRIFGIQVFTSWDVYKLFAIRPPDGHRWRAHLDYLGDRGPGLGSDYSYFNDRGGLFGGRGEQDDDYRQGLFTWRGPNRGDSRVYFLNDGGIDVLGGNRGPLQRNPGVRGRAQWFHDQDLMFDKDGQRWLRLQGQVAYLTDRDYREQFHKQEFDTGRNLETYGYLNGATGIFGGSALVQGNVARPWVTETQALPKLDGYVIGATFFDRLSYSARGSAGYYRFYSATEPPAPVVPTDLQSANLARFDLNQELSAPFDLGPLRLTPYGVLDTAWYSRDLTGDSRGRLYGGGGGRVTLPYSKLYESIDSELFNLKGLYHKASVHANYLYAKSDTPYSRLPQLDRLNDDAIDQAYRFIRPQQASIVPGQDGIDLMTSPVFDPQRLAIRRVLENKVDTLDSIHVLQLEQRHRFQTKRGFPGSEHTVDVLTINTSVSIFPEKARDNFGKTFGLYEYGALWNVGDRTAISSSGWFDPFDTGARYFSIGSNFNRPDGTNFFFGYRHIDPIRSRAVTAAVGYQLSRRYSTFLSSTYDFGINEALTNMVSINRTGSDVTISLGFSYNAIVNNFGVQLMVIPNVAALFSNQLAGRYFGTSLLGAR